ncbi:MAG: CDP-alcohol phosphatidyltransferase family protein [Patescibacteria group bacterium]
MNVNTVLMIFESMYYQLDRQLVSFIKEHRSIQKITPNFVTVLHLASIVPVIVLFQNQQLTQAFLVYLIAWPLDLLDGALARATKKETELGAFLDPLVDKLIFLVPLAIFFEGTVDQFFVWALILVEGSLVITRIFKMIDSLATGEKADLKANISGKLKCNLEIIGILLLFLSQIANTYVLVRVANAVLGFALLMAVSSLSKHIIKR